MQKDKVCKYLLRVIRFDKNNGHKRKFTVAEAVMDAIW